MHRDFATMVLQARAQYAVVVDAARRPDATAQEIAAALDWAVDRRMIRRALELARLPLSHAERQAALAAYGDQLERERDADLAALLDD